jgi:hypothetical protein
MQQFSDLDVQRKRYRENHDCTVKAQAAAFNISYGRAHRQLTKAGRKHRKGASLSHMAKAIELQTGTPYASVIHELGKNRKAERMTIRRFCQTHPKGVYIIASSSHAMCVRDGKLIDWTAEGPQRRIVTSVYKVEG